MESLKAAGEGVILEVKVKTCSSQTKLYKKENIIVLELQSQPENNKANIEAVKYLSKFFNSDVSIVRGLKSKNKTFLIKGTSKDQAEGMIENGR